MNKNLKKQILISCFSIILVFIFFFLQGYEKHKTEEYEKGRLEIEAKEEAELVNPYNKEWEEADKKEMELHPLSVGIYDPNGYLMQENFLSIKGHMTKCDAIGEYLNSIGKYCKTIEIVSAHKKKNNSYFTALLPDYPEILLSVTWYGITEEFEFSISNL